MATLQRGSPSPDPPQHVSTIFSGFRSLLKYLRVRLPELELQTNDASPSRRLLRAYCSIFNTHRRFPKSSSPASKLQMEKAASSEPGPETRQNASDPHQPDRFEQRRVSSASHPRTDLENDPERLAATAQGLSTTTSVVDTGENLDDYPEGGRQAFIVLFGTWCVLFCTFGLGNSIGVFQTYYVNDALRQYTSSTISWITSFMQWTLNFMPIVVCPVLPRPLPALAH